MKSELYIISGFLGSGKTTLLVNLLKNEEKAGRKAAVLMNEIGDRSIDSTLLGENAAVRDMLNGCICCTIKDEIEIELFNLQRDHEPDVIYIETTGAAHPMEVLDACASPLLARSIQVKGLITLVDCARWKERHRLPIAHRKLLEDQARWSDIVALTKTDLVTKQELEKVMHDIRLLNDQVVLQEIQFGQATETLLFKQGGKAANGHHAHHHLQVRTFSYEFVNHIPRAAFFKWVEQLPDTVLRIKGFVKFEDSDERPELFQYAYGVPFCQKQPMKLPAVLVVIGENLQKDVLQSELEKLDGVF